MMENGKGKIKRLQVEQERLLHRLRQSLLETYNTAIEISSVKKAISNGNDGFFFANDDTANKAINKQLSTFAKQMNHQLLNGIEKSWEQGKESVDNKLQTITPKDKEKQEAFERIKKTAEQSNRANAAKAFYNEKRGGFNISERIWNLAGNAKKEIEIILQNGIKEGKSADAIQKSLKGYLNEPEKLFRRVRNKETDKLEWSKAAQKYHPGQGVYRSAYKNIMRLVRTELKAANCEAVWQSMQSNPLITGYMIVLSNNHTTLSNGKKIPLKDICDDLQGTYPKSFKFRGWHPQCRCEMLPIMATSDERKDLYKKIFDDKRDEWKPKPIEDVPNGFKDWVEANKERQKSGGNVPYFVRDNFKGGMLSNGLTLATLATTITPTFNGYIPSSFNSQQQKAWIDNYKEIEKQLNVAQGKEMTFEEANELRGNLNYGKGREYSINCQSCVVANELRRRGFDVTAYGNTGKKGSVPHELSYNTELAWIDPNTGKTPQKTKCGGFKGYDVNGRIKSKTILELEKELSVATKETGRYHIDFAWTGGRSGHIITVEKLPSGTYKFYDPQNGKVVPWARLRREISLRHGVNVLRVDELQVNTSKVNGVVIGIK